MKKLIIFFLFTSSIFISAQNCNVLFSFGAYFEKVIFYNQSTVSNAHYYWNFGDGTSSNFKTPTHIFPGNGKYLVTLYANDTINNCSKYYETWMDITAYSTDSCTPHVDDSIWVYNGNTWFTQKELSLNCNAYGTICLTPNGSGPCFPTHNLYNMPVNCPSGIVYTDNITRLVTLKTTVANFDRSKNYKDCSANFEYSVVSQDNNHQRILYKAMNKNALSYKWIISGFGDAIISYADTISANYYVVDFGWYWRHASVMLTTLGQNGCKDTLIQTVAARSSSVTYVGINEFIKNEIQLKLVPNPVKDKLQLQFEQNKMNIDKITITNALGQILYEIKELKPQQEIDLVFLQSGVYFLTAYSNSAKKVFKVLKE